MMASKITYTYSGGAYTSSSKRGKKRRVVSLPKGYAKDSDGVYRFQKANPGKSIAVKNFTGTVTRLKNGQVRIAGSGVKSNPGKKTRARRGESKHWDAQHGYPTKRKHRIYIAGHGDTPRNYRKMKSSEARGRVPKAPAYAKFNPRKTKSYTVRIPKTSYDVGYVLTIRATTKAAARKQARAYCAKQYAKITGKTQKSYRLPQGTKVTEA